jgi:hypothetical protein
MKPVSDKRRAQLAEYSREKKVFLAKHHLCQVCNRRRAWDVHHRCRREGKLLLDKDFWLGVCRTCHEKIHSEPRWAREMGYLH